MDWRLGAGVSATRITKIIACFTALAALAITCANAGAAPKTLPVKPLPGTVVGFKATAADQAISLKWKAPTNAKKAGVTGYRLQYRKTGAKKWTSAPAMNATKLNVRVKRLKNGVAYQFSLSARSKLGYGKAKVITAIPSKGKVKGLGEPLPVVPPGVPAQFVVQPGFSAVRAIWSPPTELGNGAVTGYEVRLRLSGASSWGLPVALPPTARLHDFTSLVVNTPYDVSVRAINAAGPGPWSPEQSAKAVNPPGVPGGFTAVGGPARIDLSWTAPTSNGGTPITGYEVRGRKGADPYGAPFAVNGLSIRLEDIPGDGATYQFQVRAVTIAGPGDWSVAKSVKADSAPSVPQALTATNGNAVAILAWQAPAQTGDGTFGGYRVQYRRTGEPTWHTGGQTSNLNSTVSGLVNGTPYEFQVQAFNGGGSSPWTTPKTTTPSTIPAAPGVPTLTAGNGQVTVDWLAPDTGGSAITGYDVFYRATGTATWIAEASSDLTEDVTGLANGTTYEFEVRAKNANGNGAPSTTASATPIDVPTQPQSLALTPGDEQISVGWSAPASSGGSEISGYELRIRVAGGAWTVIPGPTTPGYAFTGLTNGSIYDVSVRAINGAGAGNWSNTLSATPSTVPGLPQNLELIESNASVNATWQPPADNGGNPVSGYELRYRVSPDGTWSSPIGTTSASKTISGLTNNTAYDFAARAINARGAGDWTDPEAATPTIELPDAPGAPGNIAARLDTPPEAVRISWTASSTGDPPVKYEVRTCLKDVPANCSAVQEVAAPATTASITNAKTGANIVASVKAVNDGGSSAEIKSATLFNPDFTLPVMRLDTTGGAPIVSEDDYLTASWSLDPNGTGVTGYTGQTTEIKGRGNSTWQMPKKPYRLKLTSGRPLLGMTSAKHWALLANYADPTNMRNALALHLGQMAGFAWTPHEGFVELVLNGKYVGLYELAEVVRVDANRVNVDTTNGGYLIELDERLDGPETNTFTTDHDTNVVIKEPEAATSTQKTFMSNYMKNFEHALFGAKFEDPTNGYAKYIDVDSFVDYFIIQEYVMNTDVMWSSTFFHMNGGGKLVAGPLWDFDLAFGRTLDNYFPENDWDWMRSRWAWWARLFEDDAFKAKVAARWAQLKPLLATAPGYVDTLNTKLATAAGYNRTIWPPVVTPEDPDKTYPLSVSNLKTFVTGRHGWFDGAFGN